MSQDYSTQVKDKTDYAASKGHDEIEELRQQIKDLTDKFSSAGQSALSHARQNMGEIEQQIRDKPVQSALIAAGAGFLIGALLIR